MKNTGSEFKQVFIARLNNHIEDFGGASQFARACDIPVRTLSNYMSGATEPKLSTLLKFADVLRIPITNLLDENLGIQSAPLAPHNEEFAFIPRFNVEASAGHGAIADNPSPFQFIAFRREWLRRMSVNPKCAQVLTASGDSMEPTLLGGDLLLVDCQVNSIVNDGIYVVVYGDAVFVKRVQAHINGGLTLISDNPRYKPQFIDQAEISLISIAGHVKWFGRAL